jgi:hypothetical protein
MADRSQEIHDAALVDLDARYGDVIDSSEWFVRVAARKLTLGRMSVPDPGGPRPPRIYDRGRRRSHHGA